MSGIQTVLGSLQQFNKGRARVALLLAVTLLSGTAAYAHHSFAATYIEDKVVKIEGELVEFQYRNPHSFVQVLSKDAQGQEVKWAVEWGAPAQMTGVSRDTFKHGDKVIITGHPGRDGNRLRMMSIERPSDGFKWQGSFK
jgi:hypothetical protein